MTNLDHGKFTRVTTVFHTLLALDVFLLFFSGYSIMFNDELWWLLVLMGGNEGVVAVHRVAGFALIALTIFWMTFMIIGPGRRKNFRAVLPDLKNDPQAFLQDIMFVLGRADERHPHARQFAGYTSDEVPLLSYIGKGVIWIFSVELTLLMISGLAIWSKPELMQVFQSRTVAMAFVVFHGLLGVIMFMGVMYHIFEHGFHPAFYPVEMKAFLTRDEIPAYHGDDEDHEGTGIEQLTVRPSWSWMTNLAGFATIVGIVSVLIGSIFDEGYPVPRELTVGGGPTSFLLTIGINLAVLVLFMGLVMSVYGNVLRARYERQTRMEQATAADGGSEGGD